jgi:hypothetical protein
MWVDARILTSLVVVSLTVRTARAQGLAPEGAEVESGAPAPTEFALAPAPRFGAPSRWAVALNGFGGISAQRTSVDWRAHGFGGAELRVRYLYVQAGGFMDRSDSGESRAFRETTQEHYRTVAGFVGAWVPFEDWVSLDASVGFGKRRYRNPISLYGPNGLDETTSVLTFRFGVSDRSSSTALFAATFGGALVASIDLNPRQAMWRRTFLLPGGGIGETTGTIPVGGWSVGLIVTLGFEVCACRTTSESPTAE